MITPPELRDVLTRQAEKYEVPPPDLMRLRTAVLRRRRHNHLRYGGIAAAVGVLLVTTIVIWRPLTTGPETASPVAIPEAESDVTTGVAVDDPCLPPDRVPDRPGPLLERPGGFIAEPPSDLEYGNSPCKLVFRYHFHRFGDGYAEFLSGAVWLFSDGRLITDTDRDGFLQWERRLTAQGVETLRSWAVDMLGRVVGVPTDAAFRTTIRYGGHHYFAQDPGEFVRRIDDLSWLPASAWRRQEPVRYRPAWYEVCLTSYTVDINPSEVLAQLPPRAAQALGANPMTDHSHDEMSSFCTVLPSRELKRVVDGFGEDSPSFGSYAIPADGTQLFLTFSTLMPNLEPGAHGD